MKNNINEEMEKGKYVDIENIISQDNKDNINILAKKDLTITMNNVMNNEMKNNTSWYTEEEMNNNIIELKSIFENIKKQGWIRSSRYGSTGIGKTFEDLLNKR
ncbi:MAG: hypothetical protein RSE91_00460, partial [Bacilli bacterium]